MKAKDNKKHLLPVIVRKIRHENDLLSSSCEGTTVKYLYIPIIKDGKLGPVSKVQLVQYGADVVSNGAFP